jgi:hypothetical protein
VEDERFSSGDGNRSTPLCGSFVAAQHYVDLEEVVAVPVGSGFVSGAHFGRAGYGAHDDRADRHRSEFGPERLCGIPFDPAGNEGIDISLLPGAEAITIGKAGC